MHRSSISQRNRQQLLLLVRLTNFRAMPHLVKILLMRISCGVSSWWRHQMETFSALLAFCAGNSPVTGEFPAQSPVTWTFICFLWSTPELTVELTMETPVIWDAITLIMTSSLWSYCLGNIGCRLEISVLARGQVQLPCINLIIDKVKHLHLGGSNCWQYWNYPLY